MQKLLIGCALCLLGAGLAQAETLSGTVTNVQNNALTVRTDNGKTMTLKTTDNTRYREKARKGKKKKGKRPSVEYYRPMVEEDDWIEITYTPAANEMQSAEIQEVIVYDD